MSGKPFFLNNNDVENSIVDRYGRRLNEQQGRDRESMEADMLARGIRPGSAAYDTFKRDQGEKENDAWNQIFINARGQAVNEKLIERKQPFKAVVEIGIDTVEDGIQGLGGGHYILRNWQEQTGNACRLYIHVRRDPKWPKRRAGCRCRAGFGSDTQLQRSYDSVPGRGGAGGDLRC